MSRIGKKPIEIPSGVEATIKGGTIEVKGTLGSRHFDFSEKLNAVSYTHLRAHET